MSEDFNKYYEDIVEFVNDNICEVVEKIGEGINSYTNSVEWTKFDSDGIDDIHEDDEHLCEVIGKGYINEGYILYNSHEAIPDDRTSKCRFRFFVDMNENGDFYFSYYLDDNGDIDYELTFINEADYKDYWVE